MAPRGGEKDKDNKCLGCGKTLANTHCHQCTICGLWVHKACSGISDDFFKALEEQVKNTGMAFWACRPCTAYSQGITRKVRQVETRMEQLSVEIEEVKGGVKENTTEITKVADRVNKVEEKVAAATEKNNDLVFEELRERESRRLNLVLHGVRECSDPTATGKDRQQWDKNQCMDIFQVQGLEYDCEVIKFCRRVGAAAEGPRPMVIGFYTDMERSMVLRRADRLKDTDYSDVKIAPDLTKRQRKEERDLWQEQEDRNKMRTEDQIQKNLSWAVVGARGEKRLILQPRTSAQRGGPRGRGRGRPPHRQYQPARRTTNQAGEETMEETRPEDLLGPTGAQKRKAAAGPEGQPQEKR